MGHLDQVSTLIDKPIRQYTTPNSPPVELNGSTRINHAASPQSPLLAVNQKKWFIHPRAQCAGDKAMCKIYSMIYYLVCQHMWRGCSEEHP